MIQKKRGKIKSFKPNNRYGEMLAENNRVIRVYKDNFIGPPLGDRDEVYYIEKQNGKYPGADQIEGIFAAYFKTNVLDLDKCDYDEFCDTSLEYAKKITGYDEQKENPKDRRNDKVTTSMIRKVYTQIMRTESVLEIKKLRPQFAYIAGRNADNLRVNELMHILDYLAKHAKDEDHLDNIKAFLECIIAYMKFVGE
jgi:CRISPR-associated protein Csm2